MNDYKDKSVLVYDFSLFPELAVKLAPSFKNTFYYTPGIEKARPTTSEISVGIGLEGIERVDHIWPVLKSEGKDNLLIVFTDVGAAPLQNYLWDEGWRVWGAGDAEILELDRIKSKSHLKTRGFAIGPYTIITGLDNLAEHLKRHPRLWVKCNRRGDFETFFSENYQMIESHLDLLYSQLGRNRSKMKFIVEEPIEPAVELAYDGYSIDGIYPNYSVTGIENKNLACIDHYVRYDDLPEPILETNARIAPDLKAAQCRSWFGMEIRVAKKDHIPYVIDPLARFGSPPLEVLLEMIVNWPDLLWQGADGICVDPICTQEGTWGAELVLTWAGEDVDSFVIQFPESIRSNVKLASAAKLNGEYTIFLGSNGASVVASAVACGKTRAEAVSKVKQIAEQIKGESLKFDPHALDDVEKEIRELKTYGFTL